jgi:plasmid maintenance system killer protein
MSRQEANFRAFQDKVREKDYEMAQGKGVMDERMKKRIEALSRMTTLNGATSNEEQIAQRKIQAIKEAQKRKNDFAARIEALNEKVEPTKVNVYPEPLEEVNHPHDVMFRNKFEELKKNNRKKWGIR